jgi:hypothetical protein
MMGEKERALWADFDDACKKAEDEFEQAKREAKKERDWIINPHFGWKAFAHVTEAADRRYSHKEETARAAREQKCKAAEETLAKRLDEAEAEERRVRGL